ncbi:MAG: cupin domain-containing protein [Bacteroidota bacterium]
MEKVNIYNKFLKVKDYWDPKIVGELNDQHIKLVKVLGKFIWHKHQHEDEMFLVWKGNIKMELEDKTLELGEGEFIIIPKGVKHRAIADHEAQLLLFEPATTINTGDTKSRQYTVEEPDKI